ncbi:hypothetical protein ACIGW0_10500 [Streptomyces bikiniensis]|uniref:DUF4190 domain-containing protein n=1 Tax=Streptomyces bikiniensis TaxID=1896 RepID=A0ABW8CQG5_STRBI
MTTQYENRTTGQRTAGSTGNVLSIIAIVLGVVSIVFFPIVFGVIGLVLAVIAKFVRHERLSGVALVVSAAGLVLGMILGAVVASA